jgi:hypothetical protein
MLTTVVKLATTVTPATQEQWSIETLTTAGTPGTLTAETPGALTASRKNYSNKSQQGTPTAGTPALLETPFTEGMLTRIGTPATAEGNVSNRDGGNSRTCNLSRGSRDFHSSKINNSSRDARNSRENDNSWGSSNANHRNNIGHSRVNSNIRGNMTGSNITRTLATAGMLTAVWNTSNAVLQATFADQQASLK